MALSDSTRARLTQGVEEHAAAAAEALLDEQDPRAAGAHLEWMQTAGRLLDAGPAPPRRAPLYRAALIGLVCGTLLLCAWTLKVGGNALRLELRIDGVSLGLPAGWDPAGDGGIAATRVQVPAGLGALYVPMLGSGASVPAGFELVGQRLRLDALAFAEGARLELETDAAGMRFFLRRGRAAGWCTVGEGRLDWFAAGGARAGSAALEAPPGLAEAVEFESTELDGSGAPFALRLDTEQDWRFAGLRVGAMGFRRELVPGSNRWRSTLLAGEGELLDVGRGFALRRGEWLRLEGVEGLVELSREDGAMRLLFTGRADRIAAGPQGLEQNLTPSLLEVLSRSKTTALLWGGLLFLWGLAWKLRSVGNSS